MREGKKALELKGTTLKSRDISHIIRSRSKQIGKALKRKYRFPSVMGAVMAMEPAQGSYFCSYFKFLNYAGVPVKHLYNCNFMYKKEREEREREINAGFDRAHNISRGILDCFWRESGVTIKSGCCPGHRTYKIRGENVEVEIMASGELKRVVELIDDSVLIVGCKDS